MLRIITRLTLILLLFFTFLFITSDSIYAEFDKPKGLNANATCIAGNSVIIFTWDTDGYSRPYSDVNWNLIIKADGIDKNINISNNTQGRHNYDASSDPVGSEYRWRIENSEKPPCFWPNDCNNESDWLNVNRQTCALDNWTPPGPNPPSDLEPAPEPCDTYSNKYCTRCIWSDSQNKCIINTNQETCTRFNYTPDPDVCDIDNDLGPSNKEQCNTGPDNFGWAGSCLLPDTPPNPDQKYRYYDATIGCDVCDNDEGIGCPYDDIDTCREAEEGAVNPGLFRCNTETKVCTECSPEDQEGCTPFKECDDACKPVECNVADAKDGGPAPEECFSGWCKDYKCVDRYAAFNCNYNTTTKEFNCKTALGKINTSPEKFVQNLLQIMLGISGGILLVLIIFNGYKLMTSQGDPERIKDAREGIIAAIAGILLVIFSISLLQLITADILGLPGFG